MKSRFLLSVILSLALATSAMAAGSPSTSKQPTTYSRAVQAVQAGDYKGALTLLEKVVARQPSNADAWNYIGFSHRKLKQFPQALTAYKKALAINPDHRGANEYLGELYVQTGDLAKAEERLKKLDNLCTFGCDEYNDLKKSIEAYKSTGKSG